MKDKVGGAGSAERYTAPVLRVARLGIVVFVCTLGAGCATFTDYDEPHAYPPLAPHERYDEHGRRCVDASIFDVVDAVREADRAP